MNSPSPKSRIALTILACLPGIPLLFSLFTLTSNLPLNPVGRFAGTALELVADTPAARNAVDVYLADKYGWAPGEDYVVESVSPVMDFWDADRLLSENFVDVSPGYVGLFSAVVSRGEAEYSVIVDPAISWEGAGARKCPGADGFQVGDIRALVERDALESCEARGTSPLSVRAYVCGDVAYGRLEDGGSPYAALSRGARYEYSGYYEAHMGSARMFKANAECAATGGACRVLALFDDSVPESALAGIAEDFAARASPGGHEAEMGLTLVLASAKGRGGREALARVAGDYVENRDFPRARTARVRKEDLACVDALPAHADNGPYYIFSYDDLASAMVRWTPSEGVVRVL